MKHTLLRIAGITLIIAGIAGLIFSIGGLFVLASVEKTVEATLAEQLAIIDRTLVATADGLELADASLGQAVSTTKALQTTLDNTGQAIGDTVPMVDSINDLLGQQLPATIANTQATLNSVAQSAQLVDDILGAISLIPLLGTDRYSPEVPLAMGL